MDNKTAEVRGQMDTKILLFSILWIPIETDLYYSAIQK